MDNKTRKKRAPNGSGSIRQIKKIIGGKKYVYWQARYTKGYDPVTGKQLVGSISGDTQAEVAKELREITAAIDAKTYIDPSKQLLSDWLQEWSATYLTGRKPSTIAEYNRHLENYIVPALGNYRLCDLSLPFIQRFLNDLYQRESKPLSPKTVRDIYFVLHQALEMAVKLKKISGNPCDGCVLEKVCTQEIRPFEENQIKSFLEKIKHHIHEAWYFIALFTGLREAEMLGLTWDCVDLTNGTLTVKQQLQKERKKGGAYHITSPKNGKPRTITIPTRVVQMFQQQKTKLDEMAAHAGSAWQSTVPLFCEIDKKTHQYDLVFRNALGGPLSYRTIYDCFERIVASIGLPEARVHDLRHTYAVMCLKNGDDIKTLQHNMGHAKASFTLDRYGHVIEQMRTDSANRLDNYIDNISTDSSENKTS